jgi:hypothetical protein
MSRPGAVWRPDITPGCRDYKMPICAPIGFPAMSDLTGFVKSLHLPPGVVIPHEMAFEDLRARALSRADLADDVAEINSSIHLIETTRGGGWPTEPVSEEFDYVDLVWHELEFREQQHPFGSWCGTSTTATSAALTCTRWAGGLR